MRIKETFAKILDSDTSLTEKLRTLFREQGITIAAILTAIRMIISTIVVSLTGGGERGEEHQKIRTSLWNGLKIN